MQSSLLFSIWWNLVRYEHEDEPAQQFVQYWALSWAILQWFPFQNVEFAGENAIARFLG